MSVIFDDTYSPLLDAHENSFYGQCDRSLLYSLSFVWIRFFNRFRGAVHLFKTLKNQTDSQKDFPLDNKSG